MLRGWWGRKEREGKKSVGVNERERSNKELSMVSNLLGADTEYTVDSHN